MRAAIFEKTMKTMKASAALIGRYCAFKLTDANTWTLAPADGRGSRGSSVGVKTFTFLLMLLKPFVDSTAGTIMTVHTFKSLV